MSGSKVKNPYSLPHGPEENTRLDTQHQAICKLIGDRIFHAPITAPSKILDIGCGSGIVTLELAKRFPHAQVVGVDLAPVIGLPSLPRNVSFIQGTFNDLIENGALKESEFDYIFQRMLVMGVVDWQSHANAVVGLLKPGGWVEMQDMSWHVYDRNGRLVDDRYSFIRAIQAGIAETGHDPFCSQHLAQYMRDASLRHVSFQTFPAVWSQWSESPEGDLMAVHLQSSTSLKTLHALLDKLFGSTPTYSQHQIEAFKQESAVTYEQAEEGVHQVYGVAFGQKRTG